jgi:fumarate reductase subunit C
MKKSIKTVATNYGLYLGIALTVLTGIAYSVNLDLFTEIWFGLLFIFVVIVLGIISVVKVKKSFNGFINFKDAFTSYFVTLVIGLLIGSLTSILIFVVIDPEAAIELQEKIINSQVDRLESYNVPAEVIDDTIEQMEAKGNMYSVVNILTSLIWQIAGFSVVGLIIAAIIKKRNPNEA